MIDPEIMLVQAGIFLLAGLVKGVIGFGLPTVSLALLVLASDLTTAMALLLAPSFVTNLWQAATGGRFQALVKRLWPFFAAATLTVWIGALSLDHVNPALLLSLLGAILIVYGLIGLGGLNFRLPRRGETPIGLVAGTVNGILTGLTGSFVMPGTMYLQSLGLDRIALVQAMGILFTLSTVALGVSLQGHGLLDSDLGTASALGVLPALIGMMGGQYIRKRISETVFRRVFFVSLLVLGAYIAIRHIPL